MRASGLARQALRANPWAFTGPFVTQVLASALVVAALGAKHSTDLGAPGVGEISDMSIALLLIAIYLSLLIVGLTMGAAIACQSREIALIRAVGATPRQVRASVAAQAAALAIPAALAGLPIGLLAGRAWIGGLVAHGVLPSTVVFHAAPAAPPIAALITVGTALPGGFLAAIRTSRVRPAVALSETAVIRRSRGWVRTVAGLLLVGAGGTLSVVTSRLDTDAAQALGFFVMLSMCVGSGLLAPVLLRLAAPLARLLGPAGRLAADNLAVRARSYSPAMIPLTLAASFVVVDIVAGTTEAHLTGVAQPASDLWTTYTATGVYSAFAAVAALNTLITLTMSRRRDLAVTRLAGGTRGRVAGVIVCEALVVGFTGVLVATVVSLTTIVPMLHASLGTWWPWAPPAGVIVWVLALLAITVTGTLVPALAGMRRPPVEAAG